VSPVKYELSSYIPEDDILHSHRRENLKSYRVINRLTVILFSAAIRQFVMHVRVDLRCLDVIFSSSKQFFAPRRHLVLYFKICLLSCNYAVRTKARKLSSCHYHSSGRYPSSGH
jgi:hypothetical protein